MAIHLVQEEVERFLSDDQPGVLVIAGKWGVGKTFAWNHFLAAARDNERISCKRYAYVSLFGLGTLDDLRTAIFQNTVNRKDIGTIAGIETLESVIKSTDAQWRKLGVFARLWPGAEKYVSSLEKIGFFSVKRQIVCIDDLERKSHSLDMRDVLGLVSQLKEERACKIVLLLNDERLQADDDAEFREQLEKVSDVTLRFEPTAEEAASIGVDPRLPFHEKLKANCVALGIVNIRTIKKIERMAKRLHAELADFDPRVFQQALHTVTLLLFAKLQPADAPSLDYIRSLSDFGAAFDEMFEQRERPPEQKEWQALLSAYDFGQLDELDGVILEAVREGRVDREQLAKAAGTIQKRLEAKDADQSFEEAWGLYHNSFDDNAPEVMKALSEAVVKTPAAISPTNLSGTIGLLKDLGWEGDVEGLIAGYVQSRSSEPKDFWDLANSSFGGEVRDPDVRAAFARKLATFNEGRDPFEVLVSVADGRGYDPEEVTFLATVSADDFYKIFRAHRGKELRRAIAGALWFRDIVNADEAMATITRNAVAALQRIGGESEINRRRVAQRGVNLPERDSDDEEAEPRPGE